MSDTHSGETYYAECSCGWSIERDSRASNLPKENNEKIVEKAASIHKTRPRFGDRDAKTHSISDVKTRELLTDSGARPEHDMYQEVAQ